MASDEAQACQDLLSQAKYHLDRAKSREEQERVFRQRQASVDNGLLISGARVVRTATGLPGFDAGWL